MHQLRLERQQGLAGQGGAHASTSAGPLMQQPSRLGGPPPPSSSSSEGQGQVHRLSTHAAPPAPAGEHWVSGSSSRVEGNSGTGTATVPPPPSWSSQLSSAALPCTGGGAGRGQSNSSLASSSWSLPQQGSVQHHQGSRAVVGRVETTGGIDADSYCSPSNAFRVDLHAQALTQQQQGWEMGGLVGEAGRNLPGVQNSGGRGSSNGGGGGKEPPLLSEQLLQRHLLEQHGGQAAGAGGGWGSHTDGGSWTPSVQQQQQPSTSSAATQKGGIAVRAAAPGGSAESLVRAHYSAPMHEGGGGVSMGAREGARAPTPGAPQDALVRELRHGDGKVRD